MARKLLSAQNDDLGDLAGAHARYLQLVGARRARELGDLANARAQAMSDAASARSSELLDATSARADALRKQGSDAIESARSRFLESDAYDRLKDIFPGLTRLDNRKQSRNNALLWVLGAALGVAAAGGAIYYFSRSRQPILEAEPLVELANNGGEIATVALCRTSPRWTPRRRAVKRAGDRRRKLSSADRNGSIGRQHPHDGLP